MIKAAQTTAENFSKKSLGEGWQPKTIAGLALYMIASELTLNKELYKQSAFHEFPENHEIDGDILQTIAKNVGIGAQTIRERQAKIDKFKRELIPSHFFNHQQSFSPN